MSIVLKAAQVIDGTGAAPITNGAVVVEGEKLVYVGPAATAPIPPGAEVVDLDNQTILPGLFDMHGHIMFRHVLGNIDGQAAEPLVKRAAKAAANLRHKLKKGNTFLRGCGELDWLDVSMREAIEQGFIPGPRMFIATRGIKSAHGHGTSAHAFPSGPDSMRQAVRENVQAGADCIKIFVTGGVLSQHTRVDQSYLTREEIRAVIEEAHSCGRRVTAHALGGPGVTYCLEEGIDCLEHASFIDDRQIELAAKKGTWLDNTSAGTFRDDTPEYHDKSSPIYEKMMRSREVVQTTYRKAIDAGIPITVGTDDGIRDIQAQVELMVRFGMSAMQAIVTATGAAAKCCGVENKVGTLAPGLLADLISVKGDPLADVKVLHNLDVIMKGGKRYDQVSAF